MLGQKTCPSELSLVPSLCWVCPCGGAGTPSRAGSARASRVAVLSLLPGCHPARSAQARGIGTGNSRCGGCGGVCAAAGCHCRRVALGARRGGAGPCAQQGGTGSWASLGKSLGIKNLPDARGDAACILNFLTQTLAGSRRAQEADFFPRARREADFCSFQPSTGARRGQRILCSSSKLRLGAGIVTECKNRARTSA